MPSSWDLSTTDHLLLHCCLCLTLFIGSFLQALKHVNISTFKKLLHRGPCSPTIHTYASWNNCHHLSSPTSHSLLNLLERSICLTALLNSSHQVPVTPVWLDLITNSQSPPYWTSQWTATRPASPFHLRYFLSPQANAPPPVLAHPPQTKIDILGFFQDLGLGSPFSLNYILLSESICSSCYTDDSQKNYPWINQ